ncbi:MAG TPA: FISUMP domain-containing protein [Fibrobacteraceae bacterium]|nr:FISUMP domain-containing protein [Fibrobacteraceae bacterium]
MMMQKQLLGCWLVVALTVPSIAGTLEGIVVRLPDATPLSGVAVTLQSTGDEDTTDEQGAFSISAMTSEISSSLQKNFNVSAAGDQIALSLSQYTDVKIEVWNLRGARLLALNRYWTSGSYRLRPIPENAPAGIYLVQISLGSRTATLRLIRSDAWGQSLVPASSLAAKRALAAVTNVTDSLVLTYSSASVGSVPIKIDSGTVPSIGILKRVLSGSVRPRGNTIGSIMATLTPSTGNVQTVTMALSSSSSTLFYSGEAPWSVYDTSLNWSALLEVINNSGTVLASEETTFVDSATEIVFEQISLDRISSNASSSSKMSSSSVTSSAGTSSISTSSGSVECSEAYSTDTAFCDTRDGQVYKFVQIGDQYWMARNLDYGSQVDGEQEQDDDDTVEKYCGDDDEDYCNYYGGLYQWAEAMGLGYVYNSSTASLGSTTQGICPDGWHVPSSTEWSTLVSTAGVTADSLAGYHLKDSTSGTWATENGNGPGDDYWGWQGKAGGGRYYWGYMNEIMSSKTDTSYYGWTAQSVGGSGFRGLFLTTTQSSTDSTSVRHLGDDKNSVGSETVAKIWGFSLRCVQD